jgi:type II secretory pathway component PulJ
MSSATARRGQEGIGLIEMLVAMMLFSVIGMAVFAAFASTSDSLRRNDDESQGLADVRKVVERLGRDVRNARGVALGADASHLELWIDTNSDYIQQDGERVTWRLQTSGRPGQYDCVRSVHGGPTTVQARTLISDLAFNYDRPAPGTRLVTTEMTYDAVVDTAGSARNVTFSERLRNVG